MKPQNFPAYSEIRHAKSIIGEISVSEMKILDLQVLLITSLWVNV